MVARYDKREVVSFDGKLIENSFMVWLQGFEGQEHLLLYTSYSHLAKRNIYRCSMIYILIPFTYNHFSANFPNESLIFLSLLHSFEALYLRETV